MKVAVVGGAGALGSVFGGILTGAGEDVTLVDIPGPRVAALQKEGLILSSTGGEKLINVKVTTDPSSVGACDLVMVSVKGYHTAEALENAFPMIAPHTMVMSLQNGAGNVEVIGSKISHERVIGGITAHSAAITGPNRINYELGGGGGVIIAPLSGAVTPKIEGVASMLNKAGIPTQTALNVNEVIWGKLVLNACVNPVGAISGLSNGEIFASDSGRKTITMIMSEAQDVARALGLSLPGGDDQVRRILEIGKMAAERGDKNKVSMLQDIEAGRKTEIDYINGIIVEKGEEYYIPTPVNRVMVFLVKMLEERFSEGK
ncbi:MAG: 2-dehydropantoate 2-reductase [Thermodesulfobacteriota bacterium]|nr:2-dehydropantoate 2-reductase [Thermodesulfobacteriota bacterium]